MRAIEAGILTETTKARLEELEEEKLDIKSQIEDARRTIPTFSRDDIIRWLEGFRDGDVEDIRYQKKLFKQFLRAVYLFDDHLHIVFDYNEDGEGFDVDLPEDLEEDDDSLLEDMGVLIGPDLVYQEELGHFV